MRRAAVVVALVGLALAALVSERPAAAQAAPSVTLAPTSDTAGVAPSTWSIVVTGQNWSNSTSSLRDVSIGFAGAAVPCNGASSCAVRPVNNRFTVTITPTRRPAGVYSVTAFQDPCSPSARCPVTASASFRSVPFTTLDPGCSTVGDAQTLTVNGHYFAPKSFAYVIYDEGGPDTQSRARIPTDDSGNFSVPFSVVGRDRTVVVRSYDVNQNEAARVNWLPCPPNTTTTTTSTTLPPDVSTSTTTSSTAPPSTGGTTTTVPPVVTIPPPTPGVTLVVVPPIGPPGFVARARGTGFPPGPVALAWAPGVGTFTAVAGSDGTFETQVLVFPRDRLGPRTLVATSGTASASSSFLVVPSTVQPSGRDVAQITRTRRFVQR